MRDNKICTYTMGFLVMHVNSRSYLELVPEAGIEPALPKEGDFKSPVSTISPPGHSELIVAYFSRISKRRLAGAC